MGRWKNIFACLKETFDVYPPGIKLGECVNQYIVIKLDGANKHPSFSSTVELYSVMCYVPKQRYSEMENLVSEVRVKMRELEPMILPYGLQTPSFYDDELKAHMVSIVYKNYKKVI